MTKRVRQRDMSEVMISAPRQPSFAYSAAFCECMHVFAKIINYVVGELRGHFWA